MNEQNNLPVTCARCGEVVEDGDETELIPFIPRWGMSHVVHKGCEYREIGWELPTSYKKET